MELSAKVRYALLALLELTKYHEQGEFVQIEQIAAFHKIPDRYLGQLLMALRRCGIVRSQRGVKGGYMLSKTPREITILEILTCLEGTGILEQSEYKESINIENTIVMQVWQEATQAAMAVFGRYTLQDLYDKLQDDQSINPMYYI